MQALHVAHPIEVRGPNETASTLNPWLAINFAQNMAKTLNRPMNIMQTQPGTLPGIRVATVYPDERGVVIALGKQELRDLQHMQDESA